MMCLRPPRCWVCSREPGHQGPCAAYEVWKAPLFLVLKKFYYELEFRIRYNWIPRLQGHQLYRVKYEIYPKDFYLNPGKYGRIRYVSREELEKKYPEA